MGRRSGSSSATTLAAGCASRIRRPARSVVGAEADPVTLVELVALDRGAERLRIDGELELAARLVRRPDVEQLQRFVDPPLVGAGEAGRRVDDRARPDLCL